MILRTPQESHSAVCMQPVSGNTHSGSSPHWSHTQARSHCCTGKHKERSPWLVLVSYPSAILNNYHLQKEAHLPLFSVIPLLSQVFDLVRASFNGTQRNC